MRVPNWKKAIENKYREIGERKNNYGHVIRCHSKYTKNPRRFLGVHCNLMKGELTIMNSIIYMVGLAVVIFVILKFLNVI